MLYLKESDIIMLGSVCKSLNESSNDQYIWKQKSIEMRGDSEFQHLYKAFLDRKLEEEKKMHIGSEIGPKAAVLDQVDGKELKHNCLRQMNAKKNFCQKGFKPLTMKLTGHTDTIRGIHCLGNHIISGGEDNQVLIWDIKAKRGKKFLEHMNWVTQVLLLDEYAVSAGSDRAVWIRDYKSEEPKSFGFKHGGWVTGLSQLTDTAFLTCSDDGKLIAYDCEQKQRVHTCEAHESGIKTMCQNENLICTYSPEECNIIIRDKNTFDVIGKIDNSAVSNTSVRSSYSMVLNEIGTMALTHSNILMTGESRKIKIWDTRMCCRAPVEEFKQPSFARVTIPDKWAGYKTISNTTGFRYVEDYKTLVTNFQGGNGVFTFDIRHRKALDYYKFHYYPASAFDVGKNYHKNIVVSCGSTEKLQYDLRFSDITKPFEEHDKNHYVMPGHKAIISRMRIMNDKIITGAMNGEVIVSKFGDFKEEKKTQARCTIVKSK